MAKFTTTSDGEAIHGESTGAGAFVGAVTGVSSNANGMGPGVIGESKGRGPGVFGKSINDAAVMGFRGDPKLSETPAASNEAGKAGVFGASDAGVGVVGYARDPGSVGVFAFGGLKSVALGRPLAGEFVGDIKVSGDILLDGADCAEQFDVDRDDTAIDPGTVLVIGADGILRRSDRAYDTRVAGVVAGAGVYRPGIVLDRRDDARNRRCVSLVGKVYCNVDSEYGEIGVGDLLTTSPTPGHAMKATDAARASGAIIGKAMQPWVSGCGQIPILVALG